MEQVVSGQTDAYFDQLHGRGQNCDVRKLKILSLNVAGLMNKLEYGILQHFITNYDVICISESHLEECDIENINFDDYECLFHNRKSFVRSGGLVTIIKKEFYDYCESIVKTGQECVQWTKINSKLLGFNLVIGNIYLPPTNSKYILGDELDTIYEEMADISSEINCEFCLVGDFNARTNILHDFITLESSVANEADIVDVSNMYLSEECLVNWGIQVERKNSDTKPIDKRGDQLLSLCKSTGTLIVNGRVGRDRLVGSHTCEKMTEYGLSKSLIDYAIASPNLFSRISDFYIGIQDKLLSDVHMPLSIHISFENTNNEEMAVLNRNDCTNVSKEAENNGAKFKSKWDPNKKDIFKNSFDTDSIIDITRELDNLHMESVTSSEIETFITKINGVYNEAGLNAGLITALPEVTFTKERKFKRLKKSTKDQPWFDKECGLSRKQYFKAKRRHDKYGDEQSKQELKNVGDYHKNLIKRVSGNYHKELHKKLRNLKSNNSKDYWMILENSARGKQKLGQISIQIFMEHFKKLNENTNDSSNDQINTDQFSDTSNDDSSFNNSFTEKEIHDHISKLKNGKACGIDIIINEFIKNSPQELITLITKFFNIILESGFVPQDWCIGIIVPIFKKKGSINDPDNYRGITLLSCLGKLFTLLLNSRLTHFLEMNNLLGEEQVGFRTGYSTLDHIFSLHCIINLYLGKRKRLYCAFVDYKKAFDSVDRKSLWFKLIQTGINGKVLTVIQNLYNGAKSCVKYKNELSEYFNCNVGVRQGENLSPLLFSIFLNDLEYFLSQNTIGINVEYQIDNLEYFIKLYTLLYADDTILISESPEDLQNMLNSLHDYCNKWKMSVNLSKTKIIVFSRGMVKKLPTWSFGNENIEVVHDYVYLGVTVNYNGSFTKAISKQILQSKRALFSLMAKGKRLKLPVDIKLHLFDTCITPILLYGSEIWGFSDINSIEIVQSQFIKNMLKLNKFTVNCMALGELGRLKMSKYIDNRMINFWINIVTGKSNKICHVLYNKIKEQHDSGEIHSKWFDKIKSILNDIDMSHLLNASDVDSNFSHISSIKNVIKTKLEEKYKTQWYDQVNNQSSCDSYKCFKKGFGLEPYLLLLEPKLAIPICRYRTNNNRLPITLGRYNGIDKSNRFCTLCDLKKIGNECHYILECEYFKTYRQKYINTEIVNNGSNISDKQRFSDLFNSTNISLLTNLSKFVTIIMKTFQDN